VGAKCLQLAVVDRRAVHADADRLIGHAAGHERLGGVEWLESTLTQELVQPFEAVGRDGEVEQAGESAADARGSRGVEGLGSGRADRDVVLVTRDAVGAEGDHDLRPRLLEDREHLGRQLFPRHPVQPSVRMTQESDVRLEAERPPGREVLRLAHVREGLASGEGRVRDPAGISAGRHDDRELNIRAGVECKAPTDPIGVVVGMGEDADDPDRHGSGGRSSSGSSPTVSPCGSYRSGGHQDARHERGTVGGVVTDRERLPLPAEQHLRCATRPGRRTECTRMPSTSPPRTPSRVSDGGPRQGSGRSS
jgi:hypothetical protein